MVISSLNRARNVNRFTIVLVTQYSLAVPIPQSQLGLDADAIIDSGMDTLFAAKVFLGCLYRHVSEEKLNLLQFSPGCVAEPRTGATEVMRCQLFDPGSFRAILDDMPHNPLRDPISPCLASPANASEQAARSYVRRIHP